MSGAALLFPFLFQSYLLVHPPFPPLPPGISGCSAPGALIYLVLHFLFELSSLSWDSYRLHSCAGNRCFLHNLLPYTLQHLKPLVKHCLHYHRWSSVGIIKSSERWQGECESLLDSSDVEVQSVCWLWDTFAVLLFLFKLKEKPAKVDLSYRTPPPKYLMRHRMTWYASICSLFALLCALNRKLFSMCFFWFGQKMSSHEWSSKTETLLRM